MRQLSAFVSIFFLFVGALICGGCANHVRREVPHLEQPPPPQTQVVADAVVDEAAKPYVAADDEQFSGGQATSQPMPGYPLTMIPRHLALVTVRVKLAVDAQGKVSDIRIAQADDLTTHPIEFDEAVRETVSQWRFTPLAYGRWEDVKDKQGNTIGSQIVNVAAKPYSVDYVFRFELRDGKPIVGGASQLPPGS